MSADLLVEARGLSVRYGARAAIDGIDFTIPKGRVVGLLGHNGAGKTTLLKAMVGLKAAEGQLSVLGLDPVRDRVAHARCCAAPASGWTTRSRACPRAWWRRRTWR
jgi:ABC-2 type transport system ATP-binding protein